MRYFVASLCLLVLATSSSLALAGSSQPESKPCAAAEVATDGLDDWFKVLYAYRKYGRCDDGGTAEGFSDRIEILLAKRWTTLPDFIRLSKADPAFEAFVLRHLGEITTLASARAIVSQAGSSCPKGGELLCEKIVARLEPLPQTN